MTQPLEGGKQRREQTEERAVDEDHLVIGVVHDVGQLLGEQTDVQGVEHSPGARRREVELEVTSRVPGEGRHPTLLGDPEVVEHSAEAAGALRPGGVGRPLAPSGHGGHDLTVPVVLLSAIEEVADRQRNILHDSQHGLRQ